jgi:hypothetical protein
MNIKTEKADLRLSAVETGMVATFVAACAMVGLGCVVLAVATALFGEVAPTLGWIVFGGLFAGAFVWTVRRIRRS